MKFRKKRRDAAQVNLTPLIDVVFLLLIFFMVSTSFTKERQLQIELPEAEAQAADTNDNSIVLAINADGSYSVNEQTLLQKDSDSIMKALTEVSQGNVELPLIILADANASHQSVVSAMDAASRLGFVHMRIATQQSPSNPSSR